MGRIDGRLGLAAAGIGIAELGDVTYLVNLAASMYLFSRSAVNVGLAMAAYGLGSLAGSWVGGTLVDVVRPRIWLLCGNLLASAIVLSNVAASTIAGAIVFAGCVSLASRAMLVSQQACLPLVAPNLALRGNSVVMVARRLAQLGAPSLAATLIATGRLHWVYVINCITFAVSGVAGFLSIPRGSAMVRTTKAVGKRALEYVVTIRALRWGSGVNCILGIMTGTASVVIIAYTSEILRGGAEEYAVLVTFSAVGAVLGTLTAAAIGRRVPIQMSVVSTLVVGGIVIAVLPFVTWLPAVLALRVLSGWSVNVLFILMMSNLQDNAQMEFRGRSIALARTGQDTVMIASTLLSGFLISTLGVRGVLEISGGIGILYAVMLGSSRNPFDWTDRAAKYTDEVDA
jgi:MFS family permease